ncbi:putative lipoprotein [Mycobacterium kansasii]|uniref:Putative lipoprotein n=1 Tax=Mycobacterium kansasii TaxID=1768 RepID=A0A1V3XME2_MYCKA|nr:putative lipoprotein [Mycobacterium kansasii]
MPVAIAAVRWTSVAGCYADVDANFSQHTARADDDGPRAGFACSASAIDWLRPAPGRP